MFPDYEVHSPILEILYPNNKERIINEKTKIHGIFKSDLLCTILSNNDNNLDSFKEKLLSLLPKGINFSKVCTDKEYKQLKKEFKIQMNEKAFFINYKFPENDDTDIYKIIENEKNILKGKENSFSRYGYFIKNKKRIK